MKHHVLPLIVLLSPVIFDRRLPAPIRVHPLLTHLALRIPILDLATTDLIILVLVLMLISLLQFMQIVPLLPLRLRLVVASLWLRCLLVLPIPLAAPLPTLRMIRLPPLVCVAMGLHLELRILVLATISRIRVLQFVGLSFPMTKVWRQP